MIDRRTLTFGLIAAPMLARANTAPFAESLARARTLDQMHTLSVVVSGERVLEHHQAGPAPSRAVNVKSVSKTVLATLVLSAVGRGLIRLDSPVAPHLPVPAGADSRVDRITVEHLLTMQSGLVRTSGPNYGAWVTSPDWTRYILSRPLSAEPGTQRSYSTGDFHLLSHMLTRLTGRSTLALARDWLGAPLGIDVAPWTRDPQGIYMGGNNMSFSARDLGRFGQMILQKGRWEGTEIVPQRLIAEAFRPRTRSPYSGHEYGLGWFLARLGGSDLAYARGYGGQMLYVVPEREAVIVVTSDPNRPARSRGYAGDLNALVGDVLLPEIAALG